MSYFMCRISDDIITKKLLRPRILQFWDSVHHPCVLNVTWHISCVACHLSRVGILLEGSKAKIHASSGWRVCHPLGTRCLVLIRTTIMVYCNSIDSVENLKSATYFRFSMISKFYSFEICTFIIHTCVITASNIRCMSYFLTSF